MGTDDNSPLVTSASRCTGLPEVSSGASMLKAASTLEMIMKSELSAK
jgi:hypothetical protein